MKDFIKALWVTVYHLGKLVFLLFPFFFRFYLGGILLLKAHWMNDPGASLRGDRIEMWIAFGLAYVLIVGVDTPFIHTFGTHKKCKQPELN